MRTSFRRKILVSLLLLLCSRGARAEEPFQSGSFRQACAKAAKTRRIVLVDFYTTWCGPCKTLDRVTWKDRSVRAWLSRAAVCCKIDAEKETALAARYKIEAYPTIVLLKPNGKEIDRLVGFRGPAAFLTEARQALAGIDSVTRAKAGLKGAAANSPMERMKYARALQEKGRNAEALKEYLWCLDEGLKHDMGFYGVRLSFLLGDIMSLGRRYPPAVAALKKRRDAARSALESGPAGRDIAMDFASYNEHLGEQEQTLAVYRMLRSKGSATTEPLFDSIFDTLLEKKLYADILAGSEDIRTVVEREIAMNQEGLKIPGTDPRARAELKQYMIERAAGYFEAVAGAGKPEDVDRIRDKILAYDGSAATYVMLTQHAARAGKRQVADDLVTLAKSRLSATEASKVEHAAK